MRYNEQEIMYEYQSNFINFKKDECYFRSLFNMIFAKENILDGEKL